MAAHAEIDVEATEQEVWEALSTEDGRAAWLGEEAASIWVETVEAPNRLVWWSDVGRVEVDVRALPAGGTRVAVTETRPIFPLTALARACAVVAA